MGKELDLKRKLESSIREYISYLRQRSGDLGLAWDQVREDIYLLYSKIEEEQLENEEPSYLQYLGIHFGRPEEVSYYDDFLDQQYTLERRYLYLRSDIVGMHLGSTEEKVLHPVPKDTEHLNYVYVHRSPKFTSLEKMTWRRVAARYILHLAYGWPCWGHESKEGFREHYHYFSDETLKEIDEWKQRYPEIVTERDLVWLSK